MGGIEGDDDEGPGDGPVAAAGACPTGFGGAWGCGAPEGDAADAALDAEGAVAAPTDALAWRRAIDGLSIDGGVVRAGASVGGLESLVGVARLRRSLEAHANAIRPSADRDTPTARGDGPRHRRPPRLPLDAGAASEAAAAAAAATADEALLDVLEAQIVDAMSVYSTCLTHMLARFEAAQHDVRQATKPAACRGVYAASGAAPCPGPDSTPVLVGERVRAVRRAREALNGQCDMLCYLLTRRAGM